MLLVPYRFVTGGDYSFLLLCLSVFMSVCLSVFMSVCLSVPIPSHWFSRLFFLLLADIHLIFGTLLCHTKLQIKFEFGFDRPIFHGVMALGLRKFHKLSVFRTFFLTACRYSFDIWYIALPYQVTDQVRVWFQSIHFSLSYGPCPILALP